jgi:hypothetical protein
VVDAEHRLAAPGMESAIVPLSRPGIGSFMNVPSACWWV